MRDTIDRIADVLPVVGEAALDRVWGGLRLDGRLRPQGSALDRVCSRPLDLTPDALPVIDLVPGTDNLVVAAGFSGHGFAIGPVTGPLASDLALGREPAHPLDAFAFHRFEASPRRRSHAAWVIAVCAATTERLAA